MASHIVMKCCQSYELLCSPLWELGESLVQGPSMPVHGQPGRLVKVCMRVLGQDQADGLHNSRVVHLGLKIALDCQLAQHASFEDYIMEVYAAHSKCSAACALPDSVTTHTCISLQHHHAPHSQDGSQK